MALTLNLAALPVVAGLMAGTGAMAAYVIGPTSVPAMAISAPAVNAPQSAKVDRSCETQTWPYIDSKCMNGTAAPDKSVRLVVAPRTGETPDVTSSPPLVTSDTVLRGPQNAAPARAVPDARTAAAETRQPARRVKRKTDRRFASQSYQVRAEARGARDYRPVIVVRPMRLEAFR